MSISTLDRLSGPGSFTVSICILALLQSAASAPLQSRDGLKVHLSVADGLLNSSSVDGRVMLMFAPAGVDPLDDWDVTSTPNALYGKNAFALSASQPVTLSGGGAASTDTGVWGFPNASIDDVPAGSYGVQALLNIYETVTRSDGSVVSVRFPCGDGVVPVDGYGSLKTSLTNVTVSGGAQTIDLTFDAVEPYPQFSGTEIGGCNQGNYEDTEYVKYVKIRSEALSEFWNRDMFVGATVLLPSGYDADDTETRYPVIYHQGHWDADAAAYRYGSDEEFTDQWESGTIPGQNGSADRPTPKIIIVSFRHEAPFYDDSYAVNNANLGPYGDAINDELIPLLDDTFNTIAEPYARIQDGGSTGGWISAASVVFRPDLFGACFSSYPDSLDFNSHQAIPLYTNANAYVFENGSAIPSIRTHDDDGNEEILATVELENHWELSFGTSSRSFLQWDIWNTVFGVQGYNNYPLEPWDKVTGRIYPAAVKYWRHMDLSHYITDNWDNALNLGDVLRNRILVYVGTWDNYYLNLGVQEFENNVNGRGGAGWANVTILPEQEHGGNYRLLDTWDYLELVQSWVQNHAPDGETPLTSDLTSPSARGNRWEDVLAYGGREAAVTRLAPPKIKTGAKCTSGSIVSAMVGRWDPGMSLSAVWVVNGKPSGQPFDVKRGQTLSFKVPIRARTLKLTVTGRKRGYETEKRESEVVRVS